ncbi:deoxynucleoside monophosphate kinase [Colwellia phage 9A]|uniref:Uncharacterized protein n=1 Tax=Colwellia phage 9A TaxID=765765 RepID=I3UMG8_9CAUD|nr:deoxynucleoside monophosphate kinase [Colwellia phage 9A]AFK66683.1 hypothetical protein COPG_00087 [Colwellia phage 9A]
MKRNPFEGKIFLLNSPPDSGKDYAAELLHEMYGTKHMEFKAPMHKIAMALTGLDSEAYYAIYNDRVLKENVHPLFLGFSPRDLMIWISEDVCKPQFGEDFFGKPAATGVDVKNGTVFSDSGFPIEVNPLAEVHGAENIYVVRFNRNGSHFGGDSRDYLQPEDCPDGVHFIDLKNDGDIKTFIRELVAFSYE